MSIFGKINLGGIKFKSRELPPPKGYVQDQTTRILVPQDSSAIPPLIKRGYQGEVDSFSHWSENHFYLPDTVTMFGRDWDYSGASKIQLDETQRRICDKVLTKDHRGKYPYSTIVYSTIKKEGKTTLAGAVGAYFAAQIEAPNLVLCLANDQEQSAGRIFGAMLPTFYKLKAQVPMAQSSKPEIRLPNGTIIQAIANNYAGNAGANYGLTLWSELWAYTSERSRRLYDELVPVKTRQNSIRWIETYVGFEDESDLMLKLFLRIFKDTSETGTQPNARPVPGLEDIQSEGKPCCWHIPEEGLFYYHNHTPRAPWNVGEDGDQYRREQKADLRPAQYTRLFENRWQVAEGSYIEPQEYDDAITLSGPSEEPMILAGDASQRNDTVVLVGTKKYTVDIFGEEQERFKLVYCSVWDPKVFGLSKQQAARMGLGHKAGDMDLEETIAAEIQRLYRAGLMIGPFRYDPYQMHQVAVNLRKKGIPCVEFTQQSDRLKSDTFLAKLFKKGLIDLYPHQTLESHVKHAKAKEFENEQLRIIKGTFSKTVKVDGAVALAMSTYVASQFRPEVMRGRTSSSRAMS